MKFIPPLEISSKIMTLIEESHEELILVSPYVNVTKWDKMKKCIQRAINRGVDITFIARKNATQDLSFLEQTGIKLILINDLHAKLYLNDNYGIVTSQNVVYYSDINSIDIAYKTTEDSERIELIDFIEKYIVDMSSTPVKENIINEVEYQNYDNVPQLSSWKQKKLAKYFMDKYSKVKFVPMPTYLFSGELLPFSDIMISSIYTIKIEKTSYDCDTLFAEISKIPLNFKNNFRIDLFTEHSSYYYLEFIPIENIDSDNLIFDFEHLTDCILNSESIKNIKPNYINKQSTW